MFLLDSNAWIVHMRSNFTSRLSQTFLANRTSIVSCSVVRAELLTGAYKSKDPARNVARVERLLAPFPSDEFDDAAAKAYGQIRADLERRGLKIGGNDLMIAAIALVNGTTVVTHNTGEFSRVSGLLLEDWQ